MKLNTRFVMILATLLLATLVSGVAGLRGLATLDRALEDVVRGDMKRLLVITNTRRLFRSMVVAERDHLLEREPGKRAAIEKKIAKTRQDLADELNAYRAVAAPEDQAPLADLRGAAERWIELNERVLTLARAGKPDEAYELASTHARDPVSWEKVIAAIVSKNEKTLERNASATHATFLHSRGVVVGVSLLAAVLGTIAGAFVFAGIRRTVADVVRLNTDLESQVAARTRSLADREHALRMVLESTGDGLLSLDCEGRLCGERTNVVTTWFGEPSTPDAFVWDYLFADDERLRTTFCCGFSQLVDDTLPFEVSAGQMPALVARGERFFGFELRPIMRDGALTGVLLTLREVTAQVALEAAERTSRETHAMIASLLRDRHGFESFVRECGGLLAGLSAGLPRDELLRLVHTLKGNAAVFGVTSVAERCHRAEAQLLEEGSISQDDIDHIRHAWVVALSRVEDLTLRTSATAVHVEDEELRRLSQQLQSRVSHDDIRRTVEAWRLESTAPVLQRLGRQATRIAKTLDKSLEVVTEHGGVRLPPGVYDPLWASLIHLVRNALYHGIEGRPTRLAAGKDPTAKLHLATRVDDKELVVSVSDDGRGIDWHAFERAAARQGKPVNTADERARLRALFEAGVSTADTVSDLAGRGAGLGAVKDVCESLGGRIEVVTAEGAGTTFHMSFPMAEGQAPRHAGA